MAKKMIKSSRKTTKKLRKFEDGGMAGKGPLQPTPKKEKTVEELANETVSRLTTIPGVSKTETPTPKVSTPAPKAKLLPGGFKDQAQKDAYIKNTKNLLKTKSVADLVKMKHGTAAGLAALGFKDEVKKAAPIAKTPTAKAPATKTPVEKTKNTTSTPSIKGLVQKEKGRFLKEDGKKLKAEGLRQKGIGMAIKGKGLRNKAIAETQYRHPSAKEKDSRLITRTLTMPLYLMRKGKSQVKYAEYMPSKSELNQVEIDAMKKSKMTKNKPATKTPATYLTPAQLKKKGQELKQKGRRQKISGQLLKSMAQPRESFAKRHGLPEVPKNWTKAIDITMGFIAPAGRAKGATNLFQLGSKLFKGGAKTKAGAEAIKKTVEVVKKGAETSKKGADVLAKTAKTAKSNRAAITRTQKGGIDKILRKGEGLPKVKDVVQRAANTTKSNRAAIARKQKGGLDKMLKLGEGK